LIVNQRFTWLILADRTNGRPYATMLRPSSACCTCKVCVVVAKRCVL